MPLGIARLNTLGRIVSAAAPPASTRTPKTITAYGNTQVFTEPKQFGTGSAYFDGSGDYLDVGLDGTLRFLQNNFTIELWYRPTGRATLYPLIASNNGVFGTGSWVLHDRHNSYNTKLTFWVENYSGSTPMFTSTSSITDNAWYHIAIVRNSNTWKMYINGVEEGSVSYSGNLDSGSPAYNPTIGGSSSGNNYVQGYIDEFRISNTARYTTNFTPSTSAFTNDANTVLLIHADGYTGYTTFVDDGGQTIYRPATTLTAISGAKISTAQSKIGTSSMLLTAASGDVVRATNVTVSTTFTYELWVRFNSLPGSFHMFIGSEGLSNETYFGLYNNSGTYQYTSVIAGIDRRFTPAALATDTWIHLALIKDGATWKLYENGVETTVASTSGSVPTALGMFHTTMRIGSYYNNSLHFNGYMDEIRYSNSVRYTTNFTPSTTAFTNDANTLMLIHANDYNGSTTFVDDVGQTIASRTPATLTANGNIQVSTAQSKFGGASILGDGTGDFISTPFRLDYDIARTSTWTVECWLRPSTVTGITGIANCQVYGDSRGWTLYTNGTNVQFLDAASGYTNLITSGVALAVNTWYHIALVRNGSNLRIYVDGISRANLDGYTVKNTTTGPLRIGEGSAISGGIYLDPYSEFRTLNGYMDEFRISNTARYTTNFTPSTTPFTNDANTVLLIHADGTNGSTTFTDDNA